jgi:hypothetical protein
MPKSLIIPILFSLGLSARSGFPWDGQPVQVRSSVFAQAAYTESRQELTLWFDNGAVYLYREVPPSLYARFLDAEGKGSFYHQHLKGRFPSRCERPAGSSSARRSHGTEGSPTCRRVAKGGAS